MSIRPFRHAAACLALAGTAAASSASAQQDDVASRICDRPLVPWLLIGPFPVDTGALRLDKQDIGNPTQLQARAGERAGGHVWQPVSADQLGQLDFFKSFAQTSLDNTAAYAETYLASPDDRTVRLGVESDDDVIVWLDGQLLEHNDIARGVGRGTDSLTLHLHKGVNRLVYKVVNRGGGMGMGARFLSDSPDPVGAIVVSDSPDGGAPSPVPWSNLRVGPIAVAQNARLVNDANGSALTVPLQVCAERKVSSAAAALFEFGGTRVATTVAAGASHPAVNFPARWSDLMRVAVAPAPVRQSVDSRLSGILMSSDASDAADSSAVAGIGTAEVPVTAAGLLDLLSRPIELNAWRQAATATQAASSPAGWAPLDTVLADSTVRRRLAAIGFSLQVPVELGGFTLQLHAGEFLPRGSFIVNGNPASADSMGRVTLCAPCNRGASLTVVVHPNGSGWWDPPVLRIADLGWHEIHDGAEWARFFTRDSTIAVPGDAVAQQLGRAMLLPVRTPYQTAIAQWVQRLAPAVARVRRDTIDLVGNSHIDAAWLWRWRETQGVIDATWATATKLMAKYRDMHFAASAAVYYESLAKQAPDVLARIKQLDKEGRWNVVGGWWLEPDVNMPSGESLVRQGLYGQRTFIKMFGHPAHVAWIPDTFGYPWSLPQIFLKSGLDFFVTQKLRWNDTDKWPARLNQFYWEGPDGSKIFSYIPYGYDSDLDPQTLATQERTTIDSSAVPRMLTLYGVGDHGGGPTMEMLERSHDLERIPAFPVMRDDSPTDALTRMRTDFPADGPVVRDELYLEYHRGVFTTQSEMKRWNRHMEGLLGAAEAAATVSPAPYPHRALTDAWHTTLFNQFHDLMAGSGIDSIYTDATADYREANALASGALATSLRAIAEPLDTRPLRTGDVPMLAFNPSGVARTDVVECAPPAGGDGPGAAAAWTAFDSQGRPLPTEPGDSGRIRVRVGPVPAVGTAVFFLRPSKPTPATVVPGWTLENRYLRVTIDSATGGIARMYDKVHRRDVLARGPTTNGLVLMVDRPKDYDAWNIDNLDGARTWLVARTAETPPRIGRDAFGTSITVYRGKDSSLVTQRYELPADGDRLDVETTVDWHQSHELLKAVFPLAFHVDSTHAEIPYAVIGRTTRPRTRQDSARFETPMLRFVDGSTPAGDYGVAIVNAGKYGYSAFGDTIFITLLRSPKSPDAHADMGTQTFEYSIVPHAGDWRSPAVLATARSLNEPMRAVAVNAHGGHGRGTASALTIKGGTVALGALKRAEDGDAWIVRLVETSGQATTAVLQLPWAVTVQETDLIERPTGKTFAPKGRVLSVPMGPWEIETLRIPRAP
ncbi:MAG: glycoside hydrolase family 38 C-terminal domain-containing protein [Gemmatimonadaceae bacterium]|nr:glycoside hydrolase family 38 C-terminal domain-containing protein [Gemmatimonadaceae bacterium]